VGIIPARFLVTVETTRPDGVVIREIEPRELKERLDRGDPLVLVDVREPFERLLADLPDHGQRNIPVKEIPVSGALLAQDRDIVLYCRSGPRSAWATERLMEMGFPRAFNLKGGLTAWREQVDPDTQGY
jgi:rhodanese-related sulfurtransferase